ncbi:hypothetical protein R6Q57_011733 [Mikania cordata]
MNPFNTPGYRPQMSSPNQPNFYYDPMNPALNNNLIGGSNRINKINKVINNSINKLFNNNLHFMTIVTIIKMIRIQANIIKSFQVESEEEEEEPVRPMGKKAIGKKARQSDGPMKKRLRWLDLG